ncbi:hypothetical protein [Tunicatimonas pelagia]|nr:hypothetical protein [Tunicatimonas pelagia]WKN45637.1 hypothetical protein P0M28_11780 [Tunicatimonas pelagia]
MKSTESITTLSMPQSYQQGWKTAQQQLDRQLYLRPTKAKGRGKTDR